jgi:hypothetical protein
MRFNYFSQENIDIGFIKIVLGVLIAFTVIFCGLLLLDGKSYYAQEKVVSSVENVDYINALPLKKNATDTGGGGGIALYIDFFNRIPANNSISSQTPSYAGISFIKGWAFDSFAGKPLSELYAKIGNRIFKAHYGALNANFWNNNPDLRYAGFELYFPEEIINGVDEIIFIGISADELYKYEPVIYKIQGAGDPVNIVSNTVLENMPVRNKQTLMWLDYVNNVLMTEKKEISARDGVDLHIIGWASDVDAERPLKSLYVKIGESLFECEYGIERTSVSDHFNNPDLLRTGFDITIPAKHLNGVTAISFIMLGADGVYQYDPIVYRIIPAK